MEDRRLRNRKRSACRFHPLILHPFPSLPYSSSFSCAAGRARAYERWCACHRFHASKPGVGASLVGFFWS